MIEEAKDNFWAYNLNNGDYKTELLLLDNVQFIYELSLAELELKLLKVWH